VQIGNCGSPIELDEGWLLLTHGVGPIRKYSIGAVRRDKQDSARVLARAREPLVRPEPTEREDYAMRHGERIVLPYAISYTYSNFATIKIVALLQALSQSGFGKICTVGTFRSSPVMASGRMYIQGTRKRLRL
jgi:predicted GH43/DUF377 family glycosyl hydrolase